MGSICGWSGIGLGPEMSQQTIRAMLKACGGTANDKLDREYNDSGTLGISSGLYTTNHLHQNGIRVAITGSPTWEDAELSEITEKQGLGAALIKAYRAFGKDLLSRLHGPFA